MEGWPGHRTDYLCLGSMKLMSSPVTLVISVIWPWGRPNGALSKFQHCDPQVLQRAVPTKPTSESHGAWTGYSTSGRRHPDIFLQIFIIPEASPGTWAQAETIGEKDQNTQKKDPMGLRGGERATSAVQTMARKPGPWPPSPPTSTVAEPARGQGDGGSGGCCSISSLSSWIHYLVNVPGPLIRLTVLQSADNTCDNGGTLGVVPSFLPMCSNNNNTELLNIAHISLLWEGWTVSVKRGKTLAKAPAGRSWSLVGLMPTVLWCSLMNPLPKMYPQLTG